MKWPSIQLCGSIITDSMSNILMTSTPSPNLKIIASLNGAICIQDCKLLLPLSQKLIPTSKVPEMISICLPTWPHNSAGGKKLSPSISTPQMTLKAQELPKMPWVVDYIIKNISSSSSRSDSRNVPIMPSPCCLPSLLLMNTENWRICCYRTQSRKWIRRRRSGGERLGLSWRFLVELNRFLKYVGTLGSWLEGRYIRYIGWIWRGGLIPEKWIRIGFLFRWIVLLFSFCWFFRLFAGRLLLNDLWLLFGDWGYK